MTGWSSVGLRSGEPLDRKKVILERGKQLFRQVVPKSDRMYGGQEADKVFSPPRGYKRAAESVRCSSAQCRGLVQPSQQFCPACGVKNVAFSSISEAVEMGARKQGYRRKATQLVDMDDALDFEPASKKHLTKVWGDMLSKVAGKDTSAPSTPAPQPSAPSTPAAPAQAPSTPAPAPATPVPCQDAGDVAESDADEDEWDMNNPMHCVEILENRFPANEVAKCGITPDQFSKTATFYVESLKKRTPKAPLAQHFLKDLEVITASKQKRFDWLKSWSVARKQQFMAKPSKSKAK